MSLQFSRSVRSLEVDSFRTAKIAMLLAVIIAVALLVWFVFARVTVYEISNDVQYVGDGHIVAQFSTEPRKRIQPGMPAVLRISTLDDGKTVTLPALVVGVDRETDLVEFVIVTDDSTLNVLDPDIIGQVEVEVEHITPAALVRRSSGAYLGNTEFPVSPQSLENESQ